MSRIDEVVPGRAATAVAARFAFLFSRKTECGASRRSGRHAVPFALALLAATVTAADNPPGWNPHEGGLLKYRVQIRFGEEPATMPAGFSFGRVSAVATDSEGDVYVFHRAAKGVDPLVIFDSKGHYKRSWGRDAFANPHGVRIDSQGHVWLVDNGDHTVRKYAKAGELLMMLGTKGQHGATKSSFYRPTDVGFAKDGSFYVSDGYGNSRVVKFSASGEYLAEWGKKGTGPGEFNLPHVVQVDSKQRVWVSDRENNRIQCFDGNGKFLQQWNHLGATQGMHILPDDTMWIITHRNNIENLTYDTLSGRIMKIDLATGKVLGSIESPGHWIHVSDKNEIFIGSLTGNVFRFYPGWLTHGLGVDEGQTRR